MNTNNFYLTFTPNVRKRTFTIRKYTLRGKCIAKYRSLPQDKETFIYFCECATQSDKVNFLKTEEYYPVIDKKR